MDSEKATVKVMLRNGFLKLLAEKSYLDITVTDVVRAAGVARASFYRNYASISDILDDLISETTTEFLRETYPVLCGNDEGRWRDFLLRVFSRIPKDLPQTRWNLENAGVILGRLNTKIQQIDRQMTEDTPAQKYLLFGKIGLILNILKKWIDDGMRETPEEMVEFIMSFVLLF